MCAFFASKVPMLLRICFPQIRSQPSTFSFLIRGRNGAISDDVLLIENFSSRFFAHLRDDGLFVLATDDLDYFNQIRKLTDEMNTFASETPNELPPTTFEKHFRERGLAIHRLALRKVSPVK